MPTATKEKPETAAPAAKTSFLKSKAALLVLLVVLVAAGGAYKFLMPASAAKPAKPVGGVIVALAANTLNLQDNHYLKVAVAVQLVAGKAAPADFRTRGGELVISDFSNRTVASLSTNTGRTQVMDQLEKDLKAAYPGDVYGLFLTQFVTQ